MSTCKSCKCMKHMHMHIQNMEFQTTYQLFRNIAHVGYSGAYSKAVFVYLYWFSCNSELNSWECHLWHPQTTSYSEKLHLSSISSQSVYTCVFVIVFVTVILYPTSESASDSSISCRTTCGGKVSCAGLAPSSSYIAEIQKYSICWVFLTPFYKLDFV